MISRASLAAGGVVGLIMGLLLFHLVNIAVWLPRAEERGRELERADTLKRSMAIIQQRSRTNAEIRSLSNAGLCSALGGVFADGECR